MQYFRAAIAFIDAYPYIAYSIAFLAALLEALPVVGAIVPGATIVVAVSALVATDVIGLWPLLGWTILGAVLGDGFSFWVGRRYQTQILNLWPFNRYTQLAIRSEAFFHRHGAKSIILGRFTPALRPFVPMWAGILRMPPGKFYLANIFSALLWAPAHVLPGAALGATLNVATAVAGKFALLVLLVLLLVGILITATGYALRRGLPHGQALLHGCLSWARAGDTWLHRQVRGLLDPAQREYRALALSTLVLIGAIWIFLGILEDVATGDPLVRADLAVHGLLQTLRTEIGDAVMVAITEFGDARVVIPVAVAGFLWLAAQRAWRASFYWAGSIALSSLFNSSLKLLLHRPRPSTGLYDGVGSLSFPSGHATVNAVMYGILCVLAVREIGSAWRVPLIALSVVIVALIALSRLYLGVHWLSDVLGGLSFGVAWVVLLGIAYLFHRPRHIKAHGMLGTVAAVLLIAGTYNVYTRHGIDMARYTQPEPTRMVTTDAWRAGMWQQMPAYRTDLLGTFEDPLTVQAVGALDILESRLSRQGWRLAPAWSLGGALAWIGNVADPLALPALPLLHDGKAADLTLIRPAADNSRLVFRAWRAQVNVGAGVQDPQPLWLGGVIEERFHLPLHLLIVSSMQADFNRPRDTLTTSLASARLASRGDIAPTSAWDGRVLLIDR